MTESISIAGSESTNTFVLYILSHSALLPYVSQYLIPSCFFILGFCE